MYTLPTYDNLWKEKKFKAIDTKSNICTCTDLALVLGANSLINNNNICEYYTQSKSFIGFEQIITCNHFGNPTLTRTNDSRVVIRPVIEKELDFEKYTYSKEEEILYVENGEYPQTAVDELTYLKLEKAFIYGEIQKTDKKYSMYYSSEYVKHFLDKIIVQEYIYQNQKYVRLMAKPDCEKVTLSNNAIVKTGSVVWIKVEPVIWLYDKNQKLGIAENGLITGVPYNKAPYEPYYQESFVESYLNKVFSKDLIPSKGVAKVKKFN